MLEELYLGNIVLFENARLPFAPGLNVISGETGAGKSLLASAVALVLGARASNNSIRTGAEQAVASGVFSTRAALSDSAQLREILASIPEDEPLILERSLSTKRASRMHLNSRPISISAAATLGESLIDVSAQNEHTRLMDPAYQRVLLDRYGNLHAAAKEYAESFQQAAQTRKRMQADDHEIEAARLRREQIAYLLDQIDELAYTEEDTTIEERIRSLQHAESIRALVSRAIGVLHDDDEAVHDTLGRLMRESTQYAPHCPPLAQAIEMLEESSVAIEEAVRHFQDASDLVDEGPTTLDEMISRAESIKQVARRLGCAPYEIPGTRQKLAAEAEDLHTYQADTADLEKTLAEQLLRTRDAGLSLRTARMKAGRKLSKAVGKELKELGMPEADFSVCLRPLWTESAAVDQLLDKADRGGLDEIVFQITPNPGEKPSTLANQASGGEAARSMLAIKSALAKVHAAPTLLFDEIDAGVGGRLGQVIGRKLADLARNRQVIVITHLPQIAAYADQHIRVCKSRKGDRTVAHIELLTGEARAQEIAQMIHGDAQTETTLLQAQEMIEQANT